MSTPSPPATDAARTRQWLTLSFVIFLTGVVAGSFPRAVGDGGEYVAMALNLADIGKPWLSEADVLRLQNETARIAGLEGWDIRAPLKVSRFGSYDFVHFWFYSAFAEPFVAMARGLGATPLAGFTVLNMVLITAAFWLALPRLGGWLTWLLFAGPILWWIDKAHAEVFTFSLLAITMLLIEDAPVWAVVSAGAAATQNPPILAMVPFAAVALGARGVEALRRPGVWIGLVGALVLAGLAVIFNQARHGSPSLLLSATTHGLPSLRDALVVPFDTNLGLVSAFPAFVLIIATALVTMTFAPRRFTKPGVVLAVLTLPVFLVSFAQTGNMHHGGTPGMSRYALWLVPLGIPLLAELNALATQWMKTAIACIALVSALASTFVFHPKHLDNYREPTWLATFLWSEHPAWTNPMPEIFVDVLAPGKPEQLPLAAPGCTKVLLVGRGDGQGMWPVPCFPAEVPAECRAPAALCYANVHRGRYVFSPTTDTLDSRFKYDPARTWRPSAEPTVRRVMGELDWPTLKPGAVVRQIAGLDAAFSLEGPGRVLVTMTGTRDGARLSLRVPEPMKATFVDPETGDEIAGPGFDGTPGDIWHVAVPPNHEVLLLVLRAVGR